MFKFPVFFYISFLFAIGALFANEENSSHQLLKSVDSQCDEDFKVTVSAIRGLEADPLDIPQAVSVVTSEDFRRTVYTGLEDALHVLPNIGLAQASQPYSSRQSGNTSSNYFQQGFSIRGLGGSRVLTVVDGVRQAGHGIGYGGGNLSLYDTYALEKVDVLRGVGSVMYGTDAFGGVVSIVTREPVHAEKLTFSGRSRASFDASRNMTRFGGYINVGDKDFACVFGVSGTVAQKPSAPKGATVDGGDFESYGAWFKADYVLNSQSRLRFIANTTQVEDAKIADRSIYSPYGSAPLKTSIPTYSRSELGVELWGHELSEYVDEAKLGVYWSGLKRHFNWESFELNFKKGDYARQESAIRKTDDAVNTVEVQPYIKFNFDPHTLIVGLDLGWDSVNLKDVNRFGQVQRYFKSPNYPNEDPLNPVGTITQNESSVVADAYQYRLGAYLQDTYLYQDWEFVLGGRLDGFYVKDELKNTLKKPVGASGSLSALYHYNEDTSFYTTVATGFRAPDLGERFQDTTIVFFQPVNVRGNPNLKSERAYTFEVGVKHDSDCWKVEGATFVNSIENYIGQKKVPKEKLLKTDPTTFAYDNLGHVLLYGFEGQVSLFPLPHWQCYLGGGRTYTTNNDKIALPSWIFHYGTSYHYALNQRWIEFIRPELRGIAATSSKDTLNDCRYPGFGACDIQVSFGLSKHNICDGLIIVGVKNVFDKAYYTPFFGNPVTKINPQPGRGLFVAVELGF